LAWSEAPESLAQTPMGKYTHESFWLSAFAVPAQEFDIVWQSF
jgi:hypothetical protein